MSSPTGHLEPASRGPAAPPGPPSSPAHVRALEDKVERLEETVRRLENERELLVRRRLRNLLIAGISLSIIAHISLFLYLNSVGMAAPAEGEPAPLAFQIAVVESPELTKLDLQAEDPVPELPWMREDLALDEPATTLEPDAAAATLDASDTGTVPALGGSGSGTGEGDGGGLGGSGAGTSFFGVSSKGNRFAFIVDVSGSMGSGTVTRKIDTAMKELARSVQSLPDFASFFVVLYSGAPRTFHAEWARARPNTVATLVRWLNEVNPGGGTQPGPAFEVVYSLRDRPDVIYFLTDGLIPSDTAQRVAELNRTGRRVVVNTIAFGDPTSQDLLKEIARETGGRYRFVPAG